MHFGKYHLLLLTLIMGILGNAQAVPPVLNYAGQVAVNGEAFDGNGLFKFALVNANGTTTYWSNDGTSVDGSEPQASVAVPVNGGLYSILLGNTAQQGMGAIDPVLFAQHTDAKLRVWFSDGVNGFQQLSPDRPFASVPYAFNSESAKSADTALNAETAKTADSANVAMAVQAGAVTSSMLASNAVTSDKLSPQIKADINATIGMNRLSTEVTEKLNQDKTTTNYNAPSVGSLLAVPYGSDAPAGYSLYQQGEPKDLVWEEKAPVSVARLVGNGAVISNNEIYVVGGWTDNQKITQLERYNTHINSWESLSPLPVVRENFACAALDGKLYAMGGAFLSSVDVYDPVNNSWSSGIPLPRAINAGSALASDGKIYLFSNTSESMLCFDPSLNQWTAKANMLIPSVAQQAIFFQDRIWVIGGNRNGAVLSVVQSYNIHTDSWRIETSLNESRQWLSAWIANGKIYAGGGHNGSSYLKSVEVYDPTSKQWTNAGNFPEIKYAADSVILKENVYVIGGYNGSAFSNKVFAADLNASVEAAYDLYRKDGDAPVGTPVVQSEYADGSVTTSKLDATILKYLKPEITSQPQASAIYAGGDGTVSFSAEGKYLTYQWKKDGVDLTGETNGTLNITDANATLHDGNYSVMVSNDFGIVQSSEVKVDVNQTWSTDGLIAWYPLDQNASDISGLGNHGTLKNTPQFMTQDGKSFVTLEATNDNDDTGDHILLPFSSFSPFTRITISGWLNFINSSHSNNHSAAVISFGDHEAGILAVFALNSGANSFFQNITNRTTLSLRDVQNTWVHFVITGDQEMCNGYLNGENIGTGSGLSSYSGGNAAIGRDWWGNGSSTGTRLNGSLDEIRIYDRALSAEEVQALHNLGQ